MRNDEPISAANVLVGFDPDWTTSKLGEVFETKLGKMLSPKSKQGVAPRPYLRNANVQWGYFDLRNVAEMDFSVAEVERFALREGDILVCEGGEVGRTAIWKEQIPGCCYQKAIHRLRPRDGRMLPEFFALFMLYAFRYLRCYGVPGTDTTIAHLPAEKLQFLDIPVPTLSAQRTIASVLGKIQAAVAAQQTIIDRTAELKSALMAKLFTEGTRGEPLTGARFGRVPTSWKIEPLENCAIVQTGIAKGRKLDGSDIVELPYLRVANVQDGRLDLSEIKSIQLRKSEIARFRLESGDVVLTEGGDFDKLGRGFIWQGQIDPCVHQNHVFAVRVDGSRLMPEFFAYLCQSPFGKAYFLNVAHRTTNLACINTAKLKALPVPIPTVTEQRQIVESLNAVQCSLTIATRRRRLLLELFSAMLEELMSGRIRLVDLITSEITELNHGAVAG